jgi:hypothetical protein
LDKLQSLVLEVEKAGELILRMYFELSILDTYFL